MALINNMNYVKRKPEENKVDDKTLVEMKRFRNKYQDQHSDLD